MEMSPEEMEEKKQMVLGMCICRGCPSWVEYDEQGGFCLATIGKSGCIMEEKRCICGGCPVKAKMGLKHTFFCTRGSETEQGGL